MRVEDLDEMLCSPPRLAIMLSLAGEADLSFTDLKQETGISDGNLHVQTNKLLDMKYIDARKSGSGRSSLTLFRITALGRQRLAEHLDRQQRILEAGVGGHGTRTRHASEGFRVW